MKNVQHNANVYSEYPVSVRNHEMWVVISNPYYAGRFVMFFVITNIYTKKTKGPTLMELLTATGKLIFFFTTRDVRCVHHG